MSLAVSTFKIGLHRLSAVAPKKIIILMALNCIPKCVACRDFVIKIAQSGYPRSIHVKECSKDKDIDVHYPLLHLTASCHFKLCY